MDNYTWSETSSRIYEKSLGAVNFARKSSSETPKKFRISKLLAIKLANIPNHSVSIPEKDQNLEHLLQYREDSDPIIILYAGASKTFQKIKIKKFAILCIHLVLRHII